MLTEVSHTAPAAPAHSTPVPIDEALDRLVDLNNRCIGTVFSFQSTMLDVVYGRLSYRSDIPEQRAVLFSELDLLLEAYFSLSQYTWRTHRDELTTALADLKQRFTVASDELHHCFVCKYHEPTAPLEDASLETLPDPLRSAYSRSMDTLARTAREGDITPTIEGFVRTLHASAVDSMASILWEGAGVLRHKLGWQDYRVQVTKLGRFDYIGIKDKGELLESPIGKVILAVDEFLNERGDRRFHFQHLTVTDRAFQAHAAMGHHQAFFSAVWDRAAQQYRLQWNMNEPGYGDARIHYCAQLFPLLGFQHSAGYNCHRAQATAHSEEDLRRLVKAMLFASEGLNNADIGGCDWSPEERAAQFKAYLSHSEIVRGRARAADFLDQSEFRAKLKTREYWTERQKQILALYLSDPYPLDFTASNWIDLEGERAPEEPSAYAICRAIPSPQAFLAEHIDDFYPAGTTIRQLKELYFEAAEIACHMRPLATRWYDERGQRHTGTLTSPWSASSSFRSAVHAAFDYVEKRTLLDQRHIVGSTLPPWVLKQILLNVHL